MLGDPVYIFTDVFPYLVKACASGELGVFARRWASAFGSNESS